MTDLIQKVNNNGVRINYTKFWRGSVWFSDIIFRLIDLEVMLRTMMIICMHGARFCHSNARDKSKKVLELVRRNKEEKSAFGPLLETKKDKLGRLKKLPKSAPSEVGDSESFWGINSAQHSRLRVIKSSLTPSDAKYQFSQYKTANSVNDQVAPTQTKEPEPKNLQNDHSDEENEFVKSLFPNPSQESTSASNSTQKFQYIPIINDEKLDLAYPESSEILSLKVQRPQDYSLPGVTRILSQTMSEEAKMHLENWKKRMIEKLGQEGFDIYYQKLKDDSTIMHSLIGDTLKKLPISIPNHLEPAYQSAYSILKEVTDVRLIESHVVHPTLKYRGIVDCVASYRGTMCVIDWKKSDKLKTFSSTYDSPLQVCAYIGALNSDQNYPFQIKKGLLAIAYTDGQAPSVFELSKDRLEFYWREWLKRLEKYYAEKSS